MTSKLVGGTIKGGAWAAATNETLSKEVLKLAHGDPAKAQIYANIVGVVINSALHENKITGAAVAQYATRWNLLLDAHARKIRQDNYEQLKTEFDNEYEAQLARGNPYSEEEVATALNNLMWDASVADKWGLTPAGSDLLNLFLDQNYAGHGIINIDYTNSGYKVVEFGPNSEVNKALKGYVLMNRYLCLSSITTNSRGTGRYSYFCYLKQFIFFWH